MGKEHSTNHLQMVTASMPTTTYGFGLCVHDQIDGCGLSCYNNGKCFDGFFAGKILSMTWELPVANKWMSCCKYMKYCYVNSVGRHPMEC